MVVAIGSVNVNLQLRAEAYDRKKFFERIVSFLNRDRSFDSRQRIVTLDGEIVISELKNVFHRLVQLHRRQLAGRAFQLRVDLIKVVEINMSIPKGMHKLPWLEACDLGHHHQQK